jgi:HEPN domain-containing protein
MTANELDIMEWVRIARQDSDSAQKLAGFYPAPIEVICYLSQQSIEKILKAYVIAKENKLTRTHDLKVLITKCEQYSPDFSRFNSVCALMSQYASLTRYPPILELEEYDMKQALKNALQILDFTESKLKELL